LIRGSELSLAEKSNRPFSGKEKIPCPNLPTDFTHCEYKEDTLPSSYSVAEADWAPRGENFRSRGAEYANPSTGRNFAGLSTIVLRNGYPNIACAAQRTSAQKANVTPDIENRRCAVE
jgi:hypothetical protein